MPHQAARQLRIADVIAVVEKSCASRCDDLLEITAVLHGGAGRKMVAVTCKSDDGSINPSNVPEGYEAALWEVAAAMASAAGAAIGEHAAIRVTWPHGERQSLTVSIPPDDDAIVGIMLDAGEAPCQAPRVLH